MNFRFETIKLQEIFTELDDKDQKTFNFDHKTIDWEKYQDNGMRGIRKFLLKEDESTMPKAQKKLKKLYYADLLVKVSFSFIFLLSTYSICVFLTK
jgi:alcohol-forming fatty acyl-CoA reductase